MIKMLQTPAYEIIFCLCIIPYTDAFHILNSYNKASFKQIVSPPSHILTNEGVSPLFFFHHWCNYSVRVDG
jgi:hypothetical protein